MNKETLAKQINFTADYATRTIGVDSIDYKEGQIIETEKATSWAYDNDMSFQVENEDYEYKVVFTCNNLPCHKIDYSNEKEVETLNAVEGEGEVLVPSGTKFEVTFVSTKDDYKEMGYYEIELEKVD